LRYSVALGTAVTPEEEMRAVERHYGHLARDGRDHAINRLDSHADADKAGVHRVDIAWTLRQQAVATAANQNGS
jgi:hypothetical protein